MRKIELHWDTRNEYVLTANELKSLEEKHRRELERRKKEEEEKKKQMKAQVSDLQSRGGISQNFVPQVHSTKSDSSLNKNDSALKQNTLNPNKGISLGQQSIMPKSNKL